MELYKSYYLRTQTGNWSVLQKNNDVPRKTYWQTITNDNKALNDFISMF